MGSLLVDDVARVTRQGLIRGRVVLTERSLKFRGRDGFEGRLNDVSAVLLRRYRLRDAGVERFTPLLLQTVSKYDAAFEGQMNQAGEGSLERMPMRMQATWITLAASRGVASV